MKPTSVPSGGAERPYLTFLLPCYNEGTVLAETYRRVKLVGDALGKRYEIVLVNDGSSDDTLAQMLQLAQRDPALVIVNLSRNHGHQLALSAGLHYCAGDRVLILDADLQDPPELLPQMLALMEQGADVVYAQRRSRPGDAWMKRLACAVFYRVLSRLSEIPIPLDSGDFRLISRRVLEVLLQMPERHRFLRGMVSWVGFRQVPFPYDRDKRFAGTTKYPLGRLLAPGPGRRSSVLDAAAGVGQLRRASVCRGRVHPDRLRALLVVEGRQDAAGLDQLDDRRHGAGQRAAFRSGHHWPLPGTHPRTDARPTAVPGGGRVPGRRR